MTRPETDFRQGFQQIDLTTFELTTRLKVGRSREQQENVISVQWGPWREARFYEENQHQN